MQKINDYTPITQVELIKFPNSQEKHDLSEIKIACYRSIQTTNVADIHFTTLAQAVDSFYNGKFNYNGVTVDTKDTCTKVREYQQYINSNINVEVNKKFKNSAKNSAMLIGWMVNSFDGDKRAANAVVHNSLMYFDIDGLIGDDTISKIITHFGDSLVGIWRSISGNGIGAIIKVHNMTLDEYSTHYNALSKELYTLYNINIDTQCKDICRMNYVSYDSNAKFWLTDRINYTFNHTYTPKITISSTNINYIPTYVKVDNIILANAIDYLADLVENKGTIFIKHFDNTITSDGIYNLTLSKLSNCLNAVYKNDVSDDDNIKDAFNLFIRLFPKRERKDPLFNQYNKPTLDAKGNVIYPITDTLEDFDAVGKLKGFLAKKDKWINAEDSGNGLINLAVAFGFSLYKATNTTATEVDILNTTYTDYISTPEVIRHIKNECFGAEKYTYIIAPTGTGKTKIIIETALYQHHTGYDIYYLTR